MALGADAGRIRRLVIRQGASLVLAGAVLGLFGALAASRVLSPLLYEVSPTDPATFGAVLGLLLLVALTACDLPARRATRVDPMTVLRGD